MLRVLPWESVLQGIAAADAPSGERLHGFYQQCLRYNPLRPIRVGAV